MNNCVTLDQGCLSHGTVKTVTVKPTPASNLVLFFEIIGLSWEKNEISALLFLVNVKNGPGLEWGERGSCPRTWYPSRVRFSPWLGWSWVFHLLRPSGNKSSRKSCPTSVSRKCFQERGPDFLCVPVNPKETLGLFCWSPNRTFLTPQVVPLNAVLSPHTFPVPNVTYLWNFGKIKWLTPGDFKFDPLLWQLFR